MKRNNWKWAILLIVASACTGTVGYMWLVDDMGFVDALYQTIITLSATGYQDTADLLSHGSSSVRLFTIFLNIFGLGAVAFAFTLFVRAIIEGELRQAIGQRRTRRRVRFMKSHYIVCGFGRMGEVIALSLKQDKIPVVVIDNDPAKLPAIEELGITAIQGDATHDSVLREAAIQNAKGLISVTNADPENLFITLSARQLNPHLTIVSRALTDEAEQKLLRAGASRVILPYKLGAH